MHLKHDTFLYSDIANRKLIVAIGIASLAKSDLASYGVPLGWGEICPIDVRSWKPVCHWGWCEIYSLMWESARARSNRQASKPIASDEFHAHTRAIQLYSINKVAKKLKEKQGFYFHYHSRRVAMVWNDMQWYSYSLPFLLINDMQGYVLHSHTLPFLLMQWHARICFAFTYIAIPADANLLHGYALNGYASHGYVLVGYVLNGYVLVGYVLMGYVWNGYVWDMCGVMDMCGICVVWDTPTIFWRTLRRNVFREKHPFKNWEDGRWFGEKRRGLASICLVFVRQTLDFCLGNFTTHLEPTNMYLPLATFDVWSKSSITCFKIMIWEKWEAPVF